MIKKNYWGSTLQKTFPEKKHEKNNTTLFPT